MKNIYSALAIAAFFLLNNSAEAQVTLSGTTYTENFDNISAGVPAGFFVTTTATATAAGSTASFTTTATAWNVTSAGWKNYASADGLTASATAAEQAASTDRSIAIRQTGTAGTGGDPGAALSFKIASTAGLQNFQLTFKLQSLDITSPRTTTWLVQYAVGATPTSFTTVATVPPTLTTGGTTFSNTVVNVNFGSSLDNISDIVWIRIVALSSSTGSGSRATSGIDDFTLSYSAFGSGNSVTAAAGTNAAEPNTPGSFVVTLSSAAPAGGVSVSYSLSGTATKDVDYSDPQNGSIYFAAGTTTSSVNVTVLDDQMVEPTESIVLTLSAATNSYTVNTTAATISLVDNEATVLNYYSLNNCTTTLNDGFTSQSVTGAQTWACTTFGRTGTGIQMNGFASGSSVANQDWLISPAIDLSGTNVPLLSFWSKSRFLGEGLQLFITTNYTGDVTTTSWTELNGRFPAVGSDLWMYSENIDLSAFKQANIRFAFKYTSTSSSASQWTVDDIYLFDAISAPPAFVTPVTKLLDFREQTAGTTSASKTFTFWANDVSSTMIVTAPQGFELSKDGTLYASTISYTAAELQNNEITAFARFAPPLANTTYGGYLTFSATGLNTSTILIKGNSVPMSVTLNVVNWNVEWFGSTASGQGPTDDVQQAANVKKVMEYLSADVYAFEEVVDTALFGSTIRSIPGYNYVISDYASLAYNTSDPAFSTNYASGQKLAFVYKTSVISNVTSRGLLRSSATAISNWSTGRVPFLVSATATKNGFTNNFDFIVIHGKAGSAENDYIRRWDAAKELKDTLDAFFSNRNIILLGDFNDDLDLSIFTTNGAVVSSYDPIIKDSVDGDSYKSITLPLSYAAVNSTGGNAEMIDHVVVSNEVYPLYLPFSATLYNDIEALAGITDYNTTTSDHYPVMTRYMLNGLLPVKLSAFDAVKESSTVKVIWTTASESDTKEFIVERSFDGIAFQPIGKVNAAGNSNSRRNYFFIDAQPNQGANYYRLRAVDLDGRWELSNIVGVSFLSTYTYSVKPNPARNSIVISTGTSHPVQMQIVDMHGRIVKETILKNNVTPIDISNLNRGIYIIKFIAPDVQSQKLVVE